MYEKCRSQDDDDIVVYRYIDAIYIYIWKNAGVRTTMILLCTTVLTQFFAGVVISIIFSAGNTVSLSTLAIWEHEMSDLELWGGWGRFLKSSGLAVCQKAISWRCEALLYTIPIWSCEIVWNIIDLMTTEERCAILYSGRLKTCLRLLPIYRSTKTVWERNAEEHMWT